MSMEFIVVDIDDTLLKSQKEDCRVCGAPKYTNPEPIQPEIDKLNELFKSGVIVILYTGRGWNQYKITKKQLINLGINHNELIMGKPPGPYIDLTQNYKRIGEINE